MFLALVLMGIAAVVAVSCGGMIGDYYEARKDWITRMRDQGTMMFITYQVGEGTNPTRRRATASPRPRTSNPAHLRPAPSYTHNLVCTRSRSSSTCNRSTPSLAGQSTLRRSLMWCALSNSSRWT